MKSPAFLIFAVVAAAAVTNPAHAREKTISPYIEIGQVLSADLTNNDALTYTEVAAGIDAAFRSKRAEAQISYRYERRISEDRRLGDSDVHSGLARGSVAVANGLSLEGGALATRVRADIRGAAPGILVGNVANTSQIYSFYAGPTLGTHIGVVGVSASYRYAYTKAEAPGFTGVSATQQPLDLFDDSRSQIAQASLNVKSGVVLPFGVTVSGAWERDDAGQLDQRYEGRYGRLDLIQPVSRSLALTAGVGYENIRVTQRDALLDAAGQPVRYRSGRFVTDPASPARIAYDFDGVYYDAGVVWRPSPRTFLQARAGERYGSFAFSGTFTYQPTRSLAIGVQAYDAVQTFGRQLRVGLGSLPTSFNTSSNPFSQEFNGCVFGAQGGAAGGCLNGIFQSISTSSYRARGVDAIVSINRGATRYGFGVGYANRHFNAPDRGVGFTVNGIDDESYYAQAFLAHAFDTRTAIDATVFANYYSSGIANSSDVYSVGGTASLSRQFGRIEGRASLGIYSFGATGGTGGNDDVSLQALLGARYHF